MLFVGKVIHQLKTKLFECICDCCRVTGAGSETCTEGYTRQPGDVQGWGKLQGRGGGEIVEDCNDCGALCTGIASCTSYECSPTERKCSLNDSGMRTSFTDYADYMYCYRGGE